MFHNVAVAATVNQRDLEDAAQFNLKQSQQILHF